MKFNFLKKAGMAGITAAALIAALAPTVSMANAPSNNYVMWGQNGSGQFGDGTTDDRYVPTEMALTGLSSGETIRQIDTNSETTCAVTSLGKLFCWGDNSSGQVGSGSSEDYIANPARVTTPAVAWDHVSTGYDNTCAVTTAGDAYCWGANYYGQVGSGVSDDMFNSPQRVAGALLTKDVKQIAGVGYFACALAVDDSVYCWGNGAYGALGQGDSFQNDSNLPLELTNAGFLNGNTVDQLIPGGYHVCALTTDGEVACWGGSDYDETGIAGDNVYEPTQINMTGAAAGKTFDKVVGGGYHTCGITTDNKILCWGYNSYNTIGVADTDVNEIREIEDYGNLTGDTIVDVAAGYYFTCALTSTGEVGCWGYNSDSEPYLGLGEGISETTPVPTSPDLSNLNGKILTDIQSSGWSYQIAGIYGSVEGEEPEPEVDPNKPEIKKVIKFVGATKTISDTSKKTVRNVASKINEYRVINRIVVRYYVHPKKSSKADIQLAKSRANAVKTALANRGVTADIQIMRVDRPDMKNPLLNQVMVTVQAGNTPPA